MSQDRALPADALEGLPRPESKDAEPRGRGKRRRKVSYLTANKIDWVDYKETNVLRRFVNDRGRIMPSRQTGNTAKQQRMVSSAIRKAREMALMPFVVSEMTAERGREGGYPRRPRRDDDRAPRGRDGDE